VLIRVNERGNLDALLRKLQPACHAPRAGLRCHRDADYCDDGTILPAPIHRYADDPRRIRHHGRCPDGDPRPKVLHGVGKGGCL